MFGCLTGVLLGEERTMTPEQQEALAEKGDFSTDDLPKRPGNLPDLTQGDSLPKEPGNAWTLGPTGIVGIFVGGMKRGDQIQVQAVLKGSPAEGELQSGDVITGMNGKKFVSGRHLGILIGNAIIEAEKETNGGGISFQVWRDKNYIARHGQKDVSSVDIDKLFSEARDDTSLYEWKPEEEREKDVRKSGFDKFPIDPVTMEVVLKLRVFPEYADSAPYDCPKTKKILEDAWGVLEKKFLPDPKTGKPGKGGVIEAIALIASGKPEHRKLVHEWVRGNHSPWGPPKQPIGEMFKPGYRGYKGFQSWRMGYEGLYCALYYEATGDDYVLPALKKYAIETAMGQSKLGTWGHTFAYPEFNGGEFHRMNPGYGALNAAGNRCFFLITLAKKLGVEHPEIDAAIERSYQFFGSYVDQGCIPYGDHPAYGSDDSNGKNTGVAFAMKLLGDDYGAKYFAMMSTHASFTRRGGHGHDYHGNWSAWAASMCGPEVRALAERNLRWRRTLCRMHDGRFVYHSPTGGESYKTLRDPTATEILHQAAPYKQTLITGKDPNKELWPNEREMDHLLSSAYRQFQDPELKKLVRTPWNERGTDDLFELLDTFMPKHRERVAQELGKRYQAGEKAIASRLMKLLDHEDARYRDGALHGLGACGSEVVMQSLSSIIKRLDDSHDFVRITAVKVVSTASDREDVQQSVLQAVVEKPTAVAPNGVRNAAQSAWFSKDSKIATSPFDAGLDEELVRESLEQMLTLDPVGNRGFLNSKIKVWDKDTVVRIAGPLTYAAENEQIGDQMFANRTEPAQQMLMKFGYREALEATAHRLRMKANIPRHTRPHVGFKRSLMSVDAVQKNPSAFRSFMPMMGVVLTDDPNMQVTKLVDDKKVPVDLGELYYWVEASDSASQSPSIATDVARYFQQKLDALEGTGAKLKFCRETLADPSSKKHFRMMAAMDYLVDLLGPDAIDDLVPYLGHDYWRVREHSRKLAERLVRLDGGESLSARFASVENPRAAAGILDVLVTTESAKGLEIARQALTHSESVVRMAAVKTLAKAGGEKVVTEVFAHLDQAQTEDDFIGCEDALLSYQDDASAIKKVRELAMKELEKSEERQRESLYWVLAQIADESALFTLKKAATTKSRAELKRVVWALSYSPSRKADQIMLEIAATDDAGAKIVGAQSVRRMVVGPKGYGDITDSERMDFAEKMVRLNLDRRLVRYLSQVRDARALKTLMYCLENGVASAAESLVANGERIEGLSEKDAKIAAEAIREVIEYIEVTRLRGGPEAHMGKDDHYYRWKALQARAGKALLKFHKPEKEAIPTFDDLDFE